MDERKLVRNAARGDRESFAELYIKYRDRLYRYAVFRVGEDCAADAVSDCVAEAWRCIPTLRDENAFGAWIFKLLHRSCISQIKEQKRQRAQSGLEQVELSYTEDFKGLELSQALGLLSDEEREIVLLSAVAGFSSREIGELLSLRASTVRSKLSRSLKKMREFLE
ncbi:MAG: RNA polymerase sigma factor [Ruminococcus sp.]|nr:RNA polymerase sigma factor [Ruminococcus sp.]